MFFFVFFLNFFFDFDNINFFRYIFKGFKKKLNYKLSNQEDLNLFIKKNKLKLGKKKPTKQS